MSKRKTSTYPGLGQRPSPSLHAPRDDQRKSRPARSRTPAAGTVVEAARRADEPAWARRARKMIEEMSEALDRQAEDPATAAAIDRAFAAFQLGAVSSADVARVAHLVERASTAVREPQRPPSQQALQGCAHILYNGLPSAVRKQVDFAQVLDLVRRLREQPELFLSVVRASSELLGWQHAAEEHAGRALRIALAKQDAE